MGWLSPGWALEPHRSAGPRAYLGVTAEFYYHFNNLHFKHLFRFHFPVKLCLFRVNI